MNRPLRFLVTILFLACTVFAARHAHSAALLERGTAITEPAALRELDQGRFGLGRMLRATGPADAPLANDRLFALPSMAPMRGALDADFDRYLAQHRAQSPGQSIGVGSRTDVELFDRAQLDSDRTRFVLSGIVNRMDRLYVAPESCGEIRLIYRLIRTGAPAPGEGAASPRLPMTLNVVVKASADRADTADHCAEIARRWLKAGESESVGPELAGQLTGHDGPLERVRPEDIDRIETNIQIAHAPKTPRQDFRTDYLLKVFRYDASARRFEPAALENQIDRARLLAEPELGREFKAWLLEPDHFIALDRGTLLIPEKFLATRAIAATPAGFDPSDRQPAFGLVQGDEATASQPLFSEPDVVAALQQAAARGTALQNIRSVAGFARRLNDITCAGCHQTRSIGGFHFPGVDWLAAKPSNSTVVPGSPHFFGDQARRRDILMALRDGRAPDYSRGFSSRPQLRGSTELAGTEYDDGWGAPCYRRMPGAKDNDASFRSWNCASGLACQIVGARSRIGMCFINARQRSD